MKLGTTLLIHSGPHSKLKFLYSSLVVCTFIFESFALTSSGWGPNKTPMVELRDPDDPQLFPYYFVMTLIGFISQSIGIFFLTLSYYKRRLVNNIMSTQRSILFIAFSFGMCVGSAAWIPIKSSYRFNQLGYGYNTLMVGTIFGLLTIIAGCFLLNKLKNCKPDWQYEVDQCRLIQKT